MQINLTNYGEFDNAKIVRLGGDKSIEIGAGVNFLHPSHNHRH